MERVLSLKTLAQQLGVSSATVSNALNNKGKISPELRKRIVELAKKSGYKISPHALVLQGKRLPILGLMTTSIEDGMAHKFITGADRAAQEGDFSTILSVTSHFGIKISEMEIRSVSRFDTLRIGGVLYVPAANTRHRTVEEMLEKKGIPFVLLYRRQDSDRSPAVVVDHTHGFHLGLDHLLALGHRRIAMVYEDAYRGPEVDIAAEVFREKLPKLSWESWGVSGSPASIRKLIKQRSTAFFALSDDLAHKVSTILYDAGYETPRDFSLIGFRDTIVARTMRPKLTTIHVPAEDMGYAAARWLIDEIGQRHAENRSAWPARDPINLCVPPTLMVRDSTGPAPN